jgi:hypothetical protein
MFRSRIVEVQEGKIRVPPGIGVSSFRGFLEWLYPCLKCPVSCMLDVVFLHLCGSLQHFLPVVAIIVLRLIKDLAQGVQLVGSNQTTCANFE